MGRRVGEGREGTATLYVGAADAAARNHRGDHGAADAPEDGNDVALARQIAAILVAKTKIRCVYNRQEKAENPVACSREKTQRDDSFASIRPGRLTIC